MASRPVFTEVEAIRRVLYLAKVAGCRLHICHISSPEGVEEVTRARQEGQDVTCESCPHYFVLDTDQFEEIGTLAKCSPPIRDLENQKGMWENCLTVKSTAWFRPLTMPSGNESRQHHGSMGRYCRSAKLYGRDVR